MSQMINFYTNPRTAKYVTKREDNQVQYTHCPLNKHIVLCGMTGSMKSQIALNYILLTSQGGGTFKKIILVHKKDEDIVAFLKDKLKDKLLTYRSVEEAPSVDKFPERSTDQYLYIFDDCITDKNGAAKKKIEDLFTYGRSRSITLLFITQSWFETLPYYIRKQSSFAIITSIKDRRDFNLIASNFSTINIDKEEIKRMYEYCMTKRYPDEVTCMIVNCEKCPEDKKFRRGFDEFLNPDEFRDEA